MKMWSMWSINENVVNVFPHMAAKMGPHVSHPLTFSPSHMYAWVIYDIHKNKVRQRVAKRCKFYGLSRVQKSVFLGEVKSKWVKALHTELTNAINQRTDRIFIVPMRPSDFKRIRQSGVPPTLAESLPTGKTRFV